MLSDIWSSITLKDIVIPLLTGLGGWFVALRMTRSNEKIEDRRRDDEITRQVQIAKVARDDDLTDRFKLLMDSYEKKIAELTAEIRELRTRLELYETRWRIRDATTQSAAS